jgi:hypothetical protein
MEMLVTLIGNAAVDPNFRKRFLENPVDTIDHYCFHLTKGEFELMLNVFADLTAMQREELDHAFGALENVLYSRIIKTCPAPCFWSIYPPAEFRVPVKKVA